MPKAPAKHQPLRVKAARHNPRGQGATERQRKRAMHTGRKGWRLQRLRVLQRDSFTCAECGKYGDQVDHIHGNAHEIVGDEQLQTLCLTHHSAKTMREVNKANR